MKIIKDELCQINTHPLVIYFVISSKDTKECVESLKQLNDHLIFTRGIFEFQTIEHIGKHSEEVSGELTKIIKRYNMFVRLADDGLDGFQYALHKVNFNLSPDEIDYSIKNFITEVCKQNKNLLANKIAQNSKPGSVSTEKQNALRQMQNTFHEAMKLKNFEHGVWMKSPDVETQKNKTIFSRINNSQTMPKIFVENFIQASLNNDAQFLWDWFESYAGVPNKESSDEIAQGYFDAQYDDGLKRDILRRRCPEDKPNISIEIKQITTRTLRDGNEKKKIRTYFSHRWTRFLSNI